MATYVIGDVQGCLTELKCLLAQLAFSEQDRLWFVGDLVNRGPHSLETLRFIKKLGDRATVVLGNHDLHALACYYGVRQPQHGDTLDALLTAPDVEALMHWLSHQRLFHHDTTQQCMMVHAGLNPMWSLRTTQTLAHELEHQLRNDPKTLLENLFGNTPNPWHDALTGWDRLRCAVNYFTRMRYCQADGTLDFQHKAHTPPPGFAPWFRFDHTDWQDQRIVFGHWAALDGETGKNNRIGVDTGCVWGKALTAYCIENNSKTSFKKR